MCHLHARKSSLQPDQWAAGICGPLICVSHCSVEAFEFLNSIGYFILPLFGHHFPCFILVNACHDVCECLCVCVSLCEQCCISACLCADVSMLFMIWIKRKDKQQDFDNIGSAILKARSRSKEGHIRSEMCVFACLPKMLSPSLWDFIVPTTKMSQNKKACEL